MPPSDIGVLRDKEADAIAVLYACLAERASQRAYNWLAHRQAASPTWRSDQKFPGEARE